MYCTRQRKDADDALNWGFFFFKKKKLSIFYFLLKNDDYNEYAMTPLLLGVFSFLSFFFPLAAFPSNRESCFSFVLFINIFIVGLIQEMHRLLTQTT